VDLVAINGGDGTTHVVLTAMVAVWGTTLPRVALLRGGTMNTITGGIGIRGGTRALLRRLVARIQTGGPLPLVRRSLLRVGEDPPQYGFLFGNGLIANFLEVYYAGAEPSPAKALWVLGRGILSAFVNGAAIRQLMRPIHLEVEVDGRRWPARDYLAIGAGTVDDIGFRFRPFPLAPPNPGRLQVLAIAGSPLRFVLQLPRIRLARPTRSPDIDSVVTGGFVLHADRPIAYMVDGDFHNAGQRLEVGVGPTVDLVVP
jgi:diacylglycerol kinase (ATP)